MREYNPKLSNYVVKSILSKEMSQMARSAVACTPQNNNNFHGLPFGPMTSFSMEKVQEDHLNWSLYHHHCFALSKCMCVVCSNRTTSYCFHCGQFLCLLQPRYCFEKFHMVEDLCWCYKGSLVLL